MTELTIDYTLNPSGPCLGKCFTIEMYTEVITSKKNNGKDLQTAFKETFKNLSDYFSNKIIPKEDKNHTTECFFNSKSNIPKALKIVS